MIAGRKPKPTKLKELEGNPGKRPFNQNEPQPQPCIPTCPRHLTPTARKEWHRIAPILEQLGLLTQIDRAALAAYCQNYGRWVEAENEINKLRKIAPGKLPYLYKTTNGNLITSPLLVVANKAMEQMYKFLAEFGLTPATRSRITRGGDGSGSDDPLDKFLNTRRDN